MNSAVKTCSIHAPAKINLHLEIGGIRPDGFHNLDSLFVTLDFGDDLFFELTGEQDYWNLKTQDLTPEQSFFNEIDEFSGKNNLITRAAAIFREKTGFREGIRCHLKKRIPAGAGLGGGSSDAAATLLALNCLAGTGLSQPVLHEMAATLGSDVPFFLQGGAAHVSGRGENIVSLPPPPEYFIILVKPPFKSITSEAFRLLDLNREKNTAFFHNYHQNIIHNYFLTERNIWKTKPCEWLFFNDFLPILPKSETYYKICGELCKNGAEFTGLSGSGSCCFGLFSDKEAAAGVYNTMSSETNQKESILYQNSLHFTFFLASRANPVLK